MSNKNRTIFYSQTSKGHEYNYGNPVLTITGRKSRHIIPSISTERKLLDYIKPHPQPNSKRTIIPNYEKLESNNFNKQSKINYGSLDNTFCEKFNKKQKPSIKTFIKKNKTTSELLGDLKSEIKLRNNDLNKYNFSFYIKNKYDYSSEILNLPGSNNRKNNDIKDDYENKNLKRMSNNSIANCFRQRNINSSRIESFNPNCKQKNRPYSVSHIVNKNKNNESNDKLKNYSDLIYSSNNVFYKYNYQNSDNIKNKIINQDLNYINTELDNKENYLNNFQNNNYNFKTKNALKRKNHNKLYNYEITKKANINEYPVKVQTNDNLKNSFDFYPKINNNKIKTSYFNNVYKEKENSLITHYTKRKNINSSNKLFNQVHQQDNNYSLLNYYGKNYSKKNYSQIQLC